MEYPLTMTFKIMALAPQIYVRDASGNSVCYIKQKLLRLKEKVEVFRDDSRSDLLCEINADRMIDFSARYQVTDPGGRVICVIGRKGMRSLWKACYQIENDEGELIAEIREENGWVKVLDSLVQGIWIVGSFVGYFFNPSYLITDHAGQEIMRLKKQPAFWEGLFSLEKLQETDTAQELSLVMGTLMMVLLERKRG